MKKNIYAAMPVLDGFGRLQKRLLTVGLPGAVRAGFLFLAVCSVCAAITPPMPVTAVGFKRLHEGNSLTDPFLRDTQYAATNEYAIVGMAHRLGYTGDFARIVGIAGIPVDYLWYNQPWQIEQALTNFGPFDVFIVQPFGHVNGRAIHVEGSAMAQIFRQVLAQNSNAAMLVYYTWTDGKAYYNTNTQYFNDAAFAASIQTCFSNYLEPITSVMRQEFPNNAVYAVPAGQAFVELHRRIQANGGNYSGFTNLMQIMGLNGNSVHPNRKGYYLSMMTHLSCYYQETTATSGLPYAFNWTLPWESPMTQPTGLTSNEAQALQEIAWDVTRTHPRTPVAGGEWYTSDMTPPSAPAALAASALTAKQVALTWGAATDNVAVAFYAVYRDDEYLGDTTGLTFTAGHLFSGRTNVLRVRAWDARWNFRDTVPLAIAVPPQNGSALVTWDTSSLTPTTGQTLAPARVNAAIQPGPATIIRGAGIKDAQYPLNGLMEFYRCHYTSLVESIAATCYFGFTLAPAGPAPLSLDALSIVARSMFPNATIKVALLSDRMGFAASNVLYTIDLNGWFHEVEFPLRTMAPFQYITNAVEFRIYPYNAPTQWDWFCLGSYQALPTTPTNEMRLLGTVVPEPALLLGLCSVIAAQCRVRGDRR